MKTPLSHEYLRKVLSYDFDTGVCTWLATVNSQTAVAGSRAGTVRRGYRKIGLLGKQYQAARLIWYWVHGSWPVNHIDHINGDKDDNRIANLRDVSCSVNLQNLRGAKSHNRTGLLGVKKHRNKFLARISVQGKEFHIGTFDFPIAAHEAYLNAKRQLHEGNTL